MRSIFGCHLERLADLPPGSLESVHHLPCVDLAFHFSQPNVLPAWPRVSLLLYLLLLFLLLLPLFDHSDADVLRCKFLPFRKTPREYASKDW